MLGAVRGDFKVGSILRGALFLCVGASGPRWVPDPLFWSILDMLWNAVKAAGQTSEILEAKSGIRQGCPPSTYLFLILHSVVLHDVDKRLLEHGGLMPWVFSQQTPFYDLAYADDTALIAGAAERAQQLLAVVETVASHCNLHFNWEKSVLLKSQASQNSVYNTHGAW